MMGWVSTEVVLLLTWKIDDKSVTERWAKIMTTIRGISNWNPHILFYESNAIFSDAQKRVRKNWRYDGIFITLIAKYAFIFFNWTELISAYSLSFTFTNFFPIRIWNVYINDENPYLKKNGGIETLYCLMRYENTTA